MFNAYSQAFNKQENRTGSLFEKPFERKLVDNEKYLRNLILYIHNNPVHHGFTSEIEDYKWTSYSSVISDKSTKLERDEIINYFDSINNFVYCHRNKQDFENIKHLTIEY